jgi:cytochrome b pre-mRNA-processing protein 3
MFTNLRGQAKETPAALLYRAIVTRAREPVFYAEWHVPDTIDGRFDLLTLHVFLVFEALRGGGAGASELGSQLADAVFTGFDEALRELGVSDFGMGRRIKKLANAFYGRMESYGAAVSAAQLAAAIQRNLYRGREDLAGEAAGLATYMMEARRHLSCNVASLRAGNPEFGPLPHRVKNNER